MCELFAMNTDRPAGVGHYLSRLMPRGGKIGPHADGWGVAYYEGRAARVFKDPAPAAESRFLAMLAEDQFKSSAVVAHIRKANPSVFGRETANTHPFEREWNGRSWVFAHNGKLPGLGREGVGPDSRYQPLGDTDSELAFCYILNAIAGRIDQQGFDSPLKLVETIQPVVMYLASFGEFNFILSNGECMYVHAHTNLHILQRSLHSGEDEQRMILLATTPLTEEAWQALRPGSIHVYRHGEDMLQARQAPPIYRPLSTPALMGTFVQ